MIGEKVVCRRSARAKSLTAASIGAPRTAFPGAVRSQDAVATGGEIRGLAGGLPVRFDGVLHGGTGVGPGLPEQDLAVVPATPAAIRAEFD